MVNVRAAWQQIKQWLWNYREAIAVVVFVVAAFVLSTHPVFAQATLSGASPTKPGFVEQIALPIAQLFSWVAIGVTKAIVLVIDMVVIPILHYNKFTTSPVVTQGWVVVRDLVNMFFVVILLVIAFQTIFNLGKADWKHQIPRLLIFAVVINFSRTIAGLCIDAGQVVMFTFVDAISNVAGGNFIQLFGLDKLFTFSQTYANTTAAQTNGIEVFDFFIASFLTMGLTFVILGTMLMLAAMLAFRIVILWCLIIVSPLTFFLGGAKGTVGPAEGYYAQWWKRFTGAITLGPVLTFFVWLALAAASSGSLAEKQGFDTTISADAETSGIAGIITQAFDAPHMTSLIIAISLLFAGFEVAQETASSIGGRAGKLMTAGVAGIPGLSATLAKLTAGAAPAAVIGAGRLAKAATPVPIRLAVQEGLGKGIRRTGEVMRDSGLPGLAMAGRSTMARGIGMVGDVAKEKKEHFDHAWKENAGLDYADLKRIADTPMNKLTMTSAERERIEAAQIQLLTQKDAASKLSDADLSHYSHAYHSMKGSLSDEMRDKVGKTIMLRRPEMTGMDHADSPAEQQRKIDEQISTMSETPTSLKNINAESFKQPRVIAALQGRTFRYNDEEINAMDWIRKYGNDTQKAALVEHGGQDLETKLQALKAAKGTPTEAAHAAELKQAIKMIDGKNLGDTLKAAQAAATKGGRTFSLSDADFAVAFNENASSQALAGVMADPTLKGDMASSINAASVEQMVERVAPERLRELARDPAIKRAMETAIAARPATTPAQQQKNVVLKLKVGLGSDSVGYDTSATPPKFRTVADQTLFEDTVKLNPTIILEMGKDFAQNDYTNDAAKVTAEKVDEATITRMQSRIANESLSQAERDLATRFVIQLEQALLANPTVSDYKKKMKRIKEIRKRKLI